MTAPTAEALEQRARVTDADRHLYLTLGIFHTCEDRMILAGWADDSAKMQAIAKHRAAGVAAERERAAGVAKDGADNAGDESELRMTTQIAAAILEGWQP